MGNNQIVYTATDINGNLSISFFGNGDYAGDAHLAIGRANVDNLKADAIVVNDNGMMCVSNIVVNGKIADIYDFNYYAAEPLGPILSKHAARLQLGWSSGLANAFVTQNIPGKTFMSTIIFENKVIDLFVDVYDQNQGYIRNYKICY